MVMMILSEREEAGKIFMSDVTFFPTPYCQGGN